MHLIEVQVCGTKVNTEADASVPLRMLQRPQREQKRWFPTAKFMGETVDDEKITCKAMQNAALWWWNHDNSAMKVKHITMNLSTISGW